MFHAPSRTAIACSSLLSIVAASSTAIAQDPGTSYHLRLDRQVSRVVEDSLRARYDILPGTGQRLEVILSLAEYPGFQQLGFKTTLIARGEPFGSLHDAPDPNYYTPAEIEAKIDGYVRAYPALARKIDLSSMAGGSKTHQGRSMFALKVSDNVAVDEDEPAILVASQHHARELNTPVVVFHLIDKILAGYAGNAALRNLVNGYELLFVPCVNPDGVNAVWTRDNLWRKNLRGGYGVDLNRNYTFLWGSCGSSTRTSSQIYRGPSAGSEPESQTMMALQRHYRPEIYLDFHSYGQEVLFTYAPCATVNGSIRGLLQGYSDRLRGPMTYAARAPSASGEAPEFHWADGGSMSFLTEVGRSFQPTYTSAVSEAVRVWPGVQSALTSWRPAVRGHVTSIHKNQPVAATITYSTNPFVHGEKSASRSRDGRYSMWLARGTYKLRFAAPGYRTVTRTVSIASLDNPKTVDIVMIPNMAAAVLTKAGADRLGTTSTLTYTSTGDANERFWIVLALGNTPGLPVGAGRTIGLNPDGLFLYTVRPNTLLLNNTGVLPASGTATASFPIPNLQELHGLTVYAGGITASADYLGFVKNFSPSIPITLRR